MTLFKKLLRDLLDHKGANIAAMIVIAVGLMMYSSFSMVMDTLTLSIDTFYTQSAFPDGFASARAIPEDSVENIESIEGVTQAEGRLVEDIRIEDGFGAPSSETKYIRAISITQNVGTYLLEEGRQPDPSKLEIVMDPMFAQANDLKVGDSIPVTAYGKKSSLNISGIGRSAEYIYALKNQAEIYPDPVIFGVGFMDAEVLFNLTGKSQYSDVVFSTSPNADFNSIERAVEKELRSNGFIGIIKKENQSSNELLQNEVDQLDVTAVVLPIVFLSVAAMILYIMIKRMVEQQRGQIGILKAFGYSHFSIRLHYTLYALIVGIMGGVLGGLAGTMMSFSLIELYRQFFNMPLLENQFSIKYLFNSIALSSIFGLVAGYRGSTQAIKLSPSEAMRDEEPIFGSVSIFEKIPFLPLLVTSRGKMALRNISRNPMRSFFVFIGITFTFALSVIPWSFMSQIDVMLFDRYEQVERYDIKMYLSGMNPLYQTEDEIMRSNEVSRAEGMLEIPAMLYNEHIKKQIAIIGLKEDSSLYTVLNDDKEKILIEKGGILLSERLAELLKAKTGDMLKLNSPFMKDKDSFVYVRVIDVVEQSVGVNGYMDIEFLSDILGYAPSANSVIMSARPGTAAVLKDKYEDSPKVVGVNDTNEMIDKLRKFMDSSTGSMYYIAVIAVVMGFAIIYNSYVVILSERKRELSSLMVLGMAEKDVLSIINFEQWFIAFFAMLFGIPLAQMSVTAIGEAASTDMFSMSIQIGPSSLLIAALVTVGAILMAQLTAARRVKRLNIVDALKSRE